MSIRNRVTQEQFERKAEAAAWGVRAHKHNGIRIAHPVSVPENRLPEPGTPKTRAQLRVDMCMRQADPCEGRCKIGFDGELVECARHRFEAADSDDRVSKFLNVNGGPDAMSTSGTWLGDDWDRAGISTYPKTQGIWRMPQ